MCSDSDRLSRMGAPRKYIATVGTQYGRWTILAELTPTARGQRQVRVQCSCGRIEVRRLSWIATASHPGCGSCWQIQHGHRRRGMTDAEYGIWKDMNKRCSNPRALAYHNYGGRGIRVSEAWRISFPTFLADVGLRPSPAHSLDRIDVNGDYVKGNVRWATDAEQGQNIRAVRFRDLDDNRMSVSAMARYLALPVHLLRYQFQRLGLSPDHGAARVRPLRNGSKNWLPLHS